MASIDSFRLRRDSHNHQPRVKPTSFRVSLKARTLICPAVNTQKCDWWPWGDTVPKKNVFELRYAANNGLIWEVRDRAAEEGGNHNVGGGAVGGGSGLLAGRKRTAGVRAFAQQMLKRPQCLLRANGSLLAGKQASLQLAFNRRTARIQESDKQAALVLHAFSTLRLTRKNQQRRILSRGTFDSATQRYFNIF